MKFILALFFLALTTTVCAQLEYSVYFESNKYDIIPKEINQLNEWISSNPNMKILGIHGFCDEDGTSGFNDTLAKRRIDFTYDYIKDKVKIREDFKTRNFGELHSLSKTKAENRKVTLYYIEAKDLNQENKILGITENEIPKQEKELPKVKVKYPKKIIFDHPNGKQSEYKLDVDFMNKIGEAQVGEKLIIENLIFQINTYIVVPSSRGKMYELLLVLKSNPNLKIEIQGHLCCMPVDRINLSTQRAKAINNFLVANGINENRLTYLGFGSSKPLFPLPEKDESQRSANRRVEIMIVAN